MENIIEDTNEHYLKDAPIRKSIFHLSIPMIIGLSIGTVYNVINAYFVGLLRNADMLSAITLGMPIFIILMALGNMFGVGSGTYVTRLIAEGNEKKAKSIASFSIYGSFIFFVIIAALCVIFINPLVILLGAKGSVFNITKGYVLTFIILGFTVVENFVLEQLVRSTGATKESMYGMAISALVNLIFDPLLILVLHFNLVGVAIAMALGNLASAIYYFYYLQKKSKNLKNFMSLKLISIKDQMEIFKIGISELLQMSFMLVMVLLLNNFAMEYGDSVTASMGISLRIIQVPEFVSMGIVLGVMPLLAYSYSSKNFERFKETIRKCFKYIVGMSALFFIIVYFFRVPVLELFTNNPTVIHIGIYILMAMLVSLLFNGASGLFLTIFQATGSGIPTTIISVTQGILSIPILIFAHMLFGLDGLIWSTTITDLLAFTLGFSMYLIMRKKLLSKESNTHIAV